MSNYTDKMLSQMRKASPIDYDKAVKLASDFGLPLRSIVSKAISMDNVDYISKPKNQGKKVGITKAQLANDIRKALNLSPKDGDLTKVDLIAIQKAIVSDVANASA